MQLYFPQKRKMETISYIILSKLFLLFSVLNYILYAFTVFNVFITMTSYNHDLFIDDYYFKIREILVFETVTCKSFTSYFKSKEPSSRTADLSTLLIGDKIFIWLF